MNRSRLKGKIDYREEEKGDHKMKENDDDNGENEKKNLPTINQTSDYKWDEIEREDQLQKTGHGGPQRNARERLQRVQGR